MDLNSEEFKTLSLFPVFRATFGTTHELHGLLGIVLIAICDEGVTPVLTREGVHH